MDGPEGQYAKGNKPVPRTLTDFPTRMWVIAQRSSVVMKESDSTAETPHSILRRVKWRNASEQTTHQGCGSCCYSEKEHLRGEKASRFLLRPDLYSMIRSQASWVRPSRKVNGLALSCESDVKRSGDGRKIDDFILFLQLYNKYKSESVACTRV
nr:uncharacterized protein LOC105476221 isoform X7 [Macaca nemestrina]